MKPILHHLHGFTLIELVVVIVLLGILSAVALPRFINLRGDATRAKNQHILGTFNAAILTAQAKWQATGGEESIIALKKEGIPDTLFSKDGLILSASKDTALSGSATRLDLVTTTLNSETAEEHQICADIFQNLMNDSSSLSIVVQNNTTLKNCDKGAGATANALGATGDICAHFVRSTSNLGARCEYYLNYKTMNSHTGVAIMYFLAPSTDVNYKQYTPGSTCLYYQS